MSQADFDKFLKLEKRLFKLIDDPLSEGPTTSRKIMGKKERIRNKMRKLEPKIKGMKDGGLMEAIDKVKAQGMELGGEPVPAKFKGFSKLPEEVQEKMDPKLATKFEFGGDVKGKKGRMMCRGVGIARKNKGFKIT